MIEFYATHKVGFWCISLLITFVLCAVHYFLFVRPRIKPNGSVQSDLIKRFNTRELISHWLRIILFFILVYTGVAMLFKGGEGHLGPHHGFTGIGFLILLIINLASWLKDMTPRQYDWVWLRKMGGYLSREEKDLPAGRFNAGQKQFYWLMFIAALILMVTAVLMEQQAHHTAATRLGLVWSIHGLTACLATIMVIGHIYLSLLANPESARVWLDGKIRRDYIMKHHGLWLESNRTTERRKQNDLCPSQK